MLNILSGQPHLMEKHREGEREIKKERERGGWQKEGKERKWDGGSEEG